MNNDTFIINITQYVFNWHNIKYATVMQSTEPHKP